jgi:hypothetical protein
MPPPRHRRSGSMDSTTDQTTPSRRHHRGSQADNLSNTTPSNRNRRQVVQEDSDEDEDLPEPVTFMQKARMLSQRRDGEPDESPEPEQGDDLEADGHKPGFSLPHLKAPRRQISVTVRYPSKCIMFSC